MDEKDLELERLRLALETKTKTKTRVAEEDPKDAELRRLREALETKTKLKTATIAEDPKDAELRRLREALETKTKFKTATSDPKDDEIRKLREALETKTKITTKTVDPKDAEIEALKKALETKTVTKTKTVDPLDEELEKLRAEMRRTEMDTSLMSKTVTSKKREAEEKKSEAIRKIAAKADQATEVNLCFVIDITGSMQSWINEAKRIALDIDASIRKWYPTLKLHVGFVGYRDIADSVRFEVLDFTSDAGALKRKLEAIVATGGGDTPEDVVGGLGKALALSWKLTTRILIHIADAPCHGSKYHSCDDDYPRGDPSGVTLEDQMEKLADKDVNYTFVKINNITDSMTKYMQNAYSDANNSMVEFTVANLGDHVAKLLPTVTKTVADSITRTKTVLK